MKKVDIPQTLIKQYSDKELIHYVAINLRNIANVTLEDKGWNDYNFGAIMTDIEHLSAVVSALDKKINGDTDAPIML